MWVDAAEHGTFHSAALVNRGERSRWKTPGRAPEGAARQSRGLGRRSACAQVSSGLGAVLLCSPSPGAPAWVWSIQCLSCRAACGEGWVGAGMRFVILNSHCWERKGNLTTGTQYLAPECKTVVFAGTSVQHWDVFSAFFKQ